MQLSSADWLPHILPQLLQITGSGQPHLALISNHGNLQPPLCTARRTHRCFTNASHTHHSQYPHHTHTPHHTHCTARNTNCPFCMLPLGVCPMSLACTLHQFSILLTGHGVQIGRAQTSHAEDREFKAIEVKPTAYKIDSCSHVA